MPHVGLVDVEREPLRFRYRLVGSDITRGYGEEMGRYLDQLDLDGHQHEIISEYARAAEGGEPTCATWEYTRKDGRNVRCERLVLPLSSNGKNRHAAWWLRVRLVH